jgi:hypothetical protein
MIRGWKLPGKAVSFHIMPFDPDNKAETKGHVPTEIDEAWNYDFVKMQPLDCLIVLLTVYESVFRCQAKNYSGRGLYFL